MKYLIIPIKSQFFIKWQNIKTFTLKLLLTFTSDTPDIFSGKFYLKIRKIYQGYSRIYFRRNIYILILLRYLDALVFNF